MSIVLSVLSTALSVVNSAGFVLLNPGPALGDYIASSTLYGLFAWLGNWVLPTVWEYDPARFGRLRGAQLVWVGIGVTAQLISHPGAVGLTFAALQALETAAFTPYLLLFTERSSLLIRSELVRAALTTVGLAATVLLFHGAPLAYALAVLLAYVAVVGTLWATGLYRVPLVRPDVRGAFRGEALRAAFRSRPLQSVLAGRTLEVGLIQLLTRANLLGVVVAMKAGSVVVSVLAFNARRFALRWLLLGGVAMYAAGMAVVLLLNGLLPRLSPGSLRLVGPVEAAAALLPFLVTLYLTVRSIISGRAT